MRVHSLHVYPIKGCQGIELTAMHIERLGPALDRRLMVVDEQDRFLTQRTDPKLATVRVDLTDGSLTLSSPSVGRLFQIPLPYEPGGRYRDVKIWKDQVGAMEMGEEASLWFSRVLDQRVRLVRKVGRRASRGVTLHGEQVETSFADGYPILLTSVESLAQLNAWLLERGKDPVGMERFRPNIVLVGVDNPFDEESFGEIAVGEVRLMGVSRRLLSGRDH